MIIPFEFKKFEYAGRGKNGARIWKVEAIHVTTTRNNRKYTEEELRLGARSLAFRPLNINHQEELTLPYPDSSTLEMDFDSIVKGVTGRIMVAEDVKINGKSVDINGMIESGRINRLSVEQFPVKGETCYDHKCEVKVQNGVTFVGLALLTSETTPGDGMTKIRPESAQSVLISECMQCNKIESEEKPIVFNITVNGLDEAKAKIEALKAALEDISMPPEGPAKVVGDCVSKFMHAHPGMSEDEARTLCAQASESFASTGTCCHCGKEYKSNDELDTHFKAAHPEDYQKVMVNNVLERAEKMYLKEKLFKGLNEYNPNHDPETGRFTSGDGAGINSADAPDGSKITKDSIVTFKLRDGSTRQLKVIGFDKDAETNKIAVFGHPVVDGKVKPFPKLDINNKNSNAKDIGVDPSYWYRTSQVHAGTLVDKVVKVEYNPNHDPETGQFTSGDGGSSNSSSASSSKDKQYVFQTSASGKTVNVRHKGGMVWGRGPTPDAALKQANATWAKENPDSPNPFREFNTEEFVIEVVEEEQQGLKEALLKGLQKK